MDILLSLKNLAVQFPAGRNRLVRAVDGVTLDIRRGETLGLVGESGCGKTTLGRVPAGLVKPTGGEIVRHSHFRTQLIFQAPYSSLDPRMTAETIIAEGVRDVKPAGRIRHLMELVGLDPALGTRYPHEFSGGQPQRIGIARALGSDPQFVVADEPIAALDVSIQAQILNLLQELQGHLGLTHLFISHDLRAVHHVADRIAVMYLGKMVEVAPASELYGTPLMPYTQALISAAPSPDPTVELQRERIVLQGDIPSPIDPPSGCRFRTRCPQAMPECAQNEPALREILPGHLAACHAIEG
ncbi:MAG TPA: ABC transporter ATP-binding protein [Blastocatellia bacterium]|nr:ABC transporter ATP-binding protein [Blastocatellia bacterium]